jgi:hypothetical protein
MSYCWYANKKYVVVRELRRVRLVGVGVARVDGEVLSTVAEDVTPSRDLPTVDRGPADPSCPLSSTTVSVPSSPKEHPRRSFESSIETQRSSGPVE